MQNKLDKKFVDMDVHFSSFYAKEIYHHGEKTLFSNAEYKEISRRNNYKSYEQKILSNSSKVDQGRIFGGNNKLDNINEVEHEVTSQFDIEERVDKQEPELMDYGQSEQSEKSEVERKESRLRNLRKKETEGPLRDDLESREWNRMIVLIHCLINYLYWYISD